MPLPNSTPETAIDISLLLPYTITQTTDDRDGVWFKYIGQPGITIIGIFADATPTRLYTRIYTPDAVTPFPDTLFYEKNVPYELPVFEGITYYINVGGSSSGALVTGTFTLSVINGPNEIAPAGSIWIHDDIIGFPLAILSSITGEPIQFRAPMANGDTADVLPNGKWLVDDTYENKLKLYSSQAGLLASLSIPTTEVRANPIKSNKSNKFYVGYVIDTTLGGRASVTTVNDDGTFGPTTWDLGANGLVALAPSPDETILYYVRSSTLPTNAIKRWDLINNLPLSDLVASGIYVIFDNLLVLNDGTILVGYLTLSDPFLIRVVRYNSSGTVLNTYDFAGFYSIVGKLAYAIDDPNSFWIWLRVSSFSSEFRNVKISDGSTISTTPSVPLYEAGVYQGDYSPTPIRFGHSYSCTFFILREEIPAISTVGRLIVNKITVPSDNITPFGFITDASDEFSLAHGESQTIEDLLPGLYSVVEDEIENWGTAYDPSNNTELEVVAGEDTILTVINTRLSNKLSGLYYIKLGKTNDTYHRQLPSEDTIDLKIPTPFAITRYFGE